MSNVPPPVCFSLLYEARRFAAKPLLEKYMNTLKKLACCAMLGCTAIMIPSKAQAADDNDKKFLAMAAQSDVNEIKISELAEQKASNPAVKAFAKKMVMEHKQMTASMKPFAMAWGLTPPMDVDSDHKDVWNKLNGLSGRDFDKAYMDAMVKDHAKALSAFTDEAKDTKDVKFKAAVIKGKTAVAAHKNMAYDLDKKL